MNKRGQDAWGMSDGIDIIKHTGSILESWEEPPTDWTSCIIHTRGASSGSGKVLENAHPFQFPKPSGGSVVGIHNGCLSNHKDLNDKYSRKFDVDSMHIWAHRAAGLSWEELRGWGNLVWYEDGKLNFARFNSTDLNIATLTNGEVVFCSLFQPLSAAAKMYGNPVKTHWECKEYTQLQIGQNKESQDIPMLIGDLPFFRPTYLTPVYASGGYSSHTEKFKVASKEFCWMCGVSRVDRAKQLLCKTCLADQLGFFVLEESGKSRWQQKVYGGATYGHEDDTEMMQQAYARYGL